MVSRYEVWLNDMPLSAISPEIYVSDISYKQVQMAYTTTAFARKSGSYAQNPRTDSNVVSVAFAVRAYDTRERQRITQDVGVWASKGGWLKTSDRDGEKIYVRCTLFPAVSSAMRWTENLMVEFTAFDYPFWVSEIVRTASVADGESAEVFNAGNQPSDVEFTAVASSTFTQITLTCGETSIALKGLQTAIGSELVGRYTEDRHLLEILLDGVSVLDKRTPSSNDDLVAAPGLSTVQVQSNGSVFCTYRVRSVYV